MADDFVAAPDFPPGSEPWRRENEERTQALEDAVTRLTKNLNTFTRSAAAGMKATHLRISKLAGIDIPPGTPINVQVYPYAYFTPSGYPAAGANIYWGDQNDADKYEIWIRRVPTGNEYSDFYLVQGTQIGTADVRGLEVLTTYELMIRAVSPGGSYGFFTGALEFTTPNETTWIPWLGDPIVTWHPGGEFASIQWEWTEDYVPAYTEFEAEVTTPASGFDSADWGNGAKGVLAENGLIYYPPGGWVGGAGPTATTVNSSGYIFNPETGVALASDFGIAGEIPDDSSIAGGTLGVEGNIYWLARWAGDTYLLKLIPGIDVMSYTLVSGFGSYSGMARGGDGNIYCISKDDGFLVIQPGGMFSIDDLGVTLDPGDHLTPGEYFNQAVTDDNGDVWFMPYGGADDFIVVRTRPIPYAERVPIDYPGGFAASDFKHLAGPVLNPADQSVYAFSWKLTGNKKLWFRIGPDGTQEYGESTGADSYVAMGNTALGADGRIWGMGYNFMPFSTLYATGGTGYTTNTTGVFNPEDKTFGRQIVGPGLYVVDSAVADAEGRVFYRTTKMPSPVTVDPTKILAVESTRTEHPESGTTEIPNYLKHMQVQRSTADGWKTVGTLAEPGFIMDPFAVLGDVYRLIPISTAGTTGHPSASVTLTL